ncbi:MAG TPA: toxin-antitoxin system HicB family antitoxin [Pseudonocardiaceae bacterium]|nr:toxin-antitoxin system HicB family antitoxin [Pseudonocardiaceae bacterium]
MDLSPYIASLRDSLTKAAAAGDAQTRTTASVLAASIEPAARLAIMNALSDLAGEVTLALEDRVVEVRLDGQDVQVVVSGAPAFDHEPTDDPPPNMADPTGDISRITVRLLEDLKAKAEQAAAARGVSLNAFVSQAVQGALRERGRARGRSHGNPWEQDWSAWGWPGGGSGGREDDDQSGRGRRGQSRVRGWVEG